MERGGAKEASGLTRGLALVARRGAAWMLVAAAASAIVGSAVDATLLALNGSGARASIACGGATAALGVFVALATALPLALLEGAAKRIAGARSRARYAWVVPIAAFAWVVAAWITEAPLRYRQGPNQIVMAAFAVAIGTLAVLGRASSGYARAAAAGIGAVALGIDIVLVKAARDVHDLVAVLAIFGALAATAPLRRRLSLASPARLAAGAAFAIVAALLVLRGVDGFSPGWRVRAWQFARFQPRLARADRALVDVDIDGFSPVAWGGDCDDLDTTRNPFAHERPGMIDANCNGTTPSAAPTDDDRGLAPPVGDPGYDDGSVDLVLLVTFDCGRKDALRPDVMPSLTKLAASGVVFDRLYSGGSRTTTSFPLMQRTWTDAPPITRTLALAGIHSTAVFAWRDDAFTQEFVPNFETVDKPSEHLGRWDATTTTDAALARLAAHTAGKRELLWVHYYDAHDPIAEGPPKPAVVFTHSPNFPASYDRYLAAIAHIDHEMGRIFDGLASTSQAAHTVVIVTSDHGEGFGHHGVTFHSISGYESIVHVPGVLVAPGLAPGHYGGLVSHRDIPPTILGAFGLGRDAKAAEIFGRSWLRLRDQTSPAAPLHRFVVVRSARAQREAERLMPMGVIVEGNLKLIETFEDSLLEMYDPVNEPREEHDLVPTDGEDLARLRHDLALYRDIDRFP